jgi:hypothetical protein
MAYVAKPASIKIIEIGQTGWGNLNPNDEDLILPSKIAIMPAIQILSDGLQCHIKASRTAADSSMLAKSAGENLIPMMDLLRFGQSATQP